MKHRGVKFLSLLLTLAMLVGLMPGMGLTAYAAANKTITWDSSNWDGLFSRTGEGSHTDENGIAASGNAFRKNMYHFNVVDIRANWAANFSISNGKFSSIEIKYSDGFQLKQLSAGWTNNGNSLKWTGESNEVTLSGEDGVAIVTSIVFTIETADATHSVTVTPGSNMTKTVGSGAESQTGLSGAMTPVVYTANEGYYFPENYSVEAVNEISVTRNSYTQITVSGTPTADATIILTAPTAKTKPDAPTTAAAVDCTTTDNNDGKLTGVTTAMEYKKLDATDWIAGTGSDITGLVPGTYYVRLKATDTTTASDNQELTIAGYVASNYTVTYKVVNGTWSDDSTADKTETVQSGSKPASVPTGMKASNGYTSGAWDKNPADATITEATTFTYTFGAIPTFTVTYIANNGTGETKVYTPAVGQTHNVEGQLFPAPQDKEFNNWLGDDGNTYLQGAQINTNRTLTAQWKDKSQGGGSHGGNGSGADIVFNIPGVGDGWEYIGGGYAPQQAYRVSLAPMQGGSAALGLTTGESGVQMNVYPTTTVYVFPNAAQGYVLDKIVWSLIDGSASYDITEAKNFVMPAMDVVVYVTFQPLAS